MMTPKAKVCALSAGLKMRRNGGKIVADIGADYEFAMRAKSLFCWRLVPVIADSIKCPIAAPKRSPNPAKIV